MQLNMELGATIGAVKIIGSYSKRESCVAISGSDSSSRDATDQSAKFLRVEGERKNRKSQRGG